MINIWRLLFNLKCFWYGCISDGAWEEVYYNNYKCKRCGKSITRSKNK